MMDVLFLLASAGAAVGSILTVTRRNAIYAAAWMMLTLVSLAVIFVTLSSSFLGAVQVLLYAGAILVLFVFVIMMLNLPREDVDSMRPPGAQRFVGVVCAVLLAVIVGVKVVGALHGEEGPALNEAPKAVAARQLEGAAAAPAALTQAGAKGLQFGSTRYFGHTIYDRHLVAFELISVLVLAAVAGVIVLAKRRIGTPLPAAEGGGPEATSDTQA